MGTDQKNIKPISKITVESIADLISFDGSSIILIVSDLERGGIFKYTSTGYTVDNGVVFEALGKGVGYWVRQYEGAVNLQWFGIDKTGNTDHSTLMDSVINKYDHIYFPDGVIQGSINNRNSNRTFVFSNNCIIDGGVIHLAIGHGELNPDWLPGDTEVIVENITVIGKLRTTSRVGTYYCNGIYIDEIEIVEPDSYIYSPRGVHFHYGTKELYVNKIVGRASASGDYGFALNGGSGSVSFTGINRTENCFINQLIVEDSVETGVLLDKISNININSIIVKKWGGVSNSWTGLVLNGLIDSKINSVWVDSQYSTGVSSYSVRISNNSNLSVGSVKVINSPFEGVTFISPFSDSFFVNGINVDVNLSNVEIQNSLKTGLKISGSAHFGNVKCVNNNTSSDGNAANIFVNNGANQTFDNILIEDPNNYSNGLTINNGSNISVNNCNVIDCSSIGVYMLGVCSGIFFNNLKISSGAQNLRFEAGTNGLTINDFKSSGASLRDVTNISGAQNIKIGFKPGITFLTSPFSMIGFVKLGQDYSSSVPASLQHYSGHVYFNSNPTILGFIGWVCTGSGSPGIWNTFGSI